MKKLIVGLCLCLGLTFLAGISTQEIYAAEDSQTIPESSIKSAKEILFDMDTDASAELDLADDLSDTPDPSVEDLDLREALAELEEKIEKEGFLTATRAAESTIWGEANELSIREEMVQFALQYVGNPYVWGGTSLTNGADCSGFVLAVHNHFGYALPRVAADQYAASRKKDISALEPGDLVFYGNGISHVAMYIGDGQIVHAANSRLGIIVSEITWMNPVGGGTFLD